MIALMLVALAIGLYESTNAMVALAIGRYGSTNAMGALAIGLC